MLQSTAAPVRHRRNISYAKYGYIFCIPFVVAFLTFSLYPIIYTLSISFSDLKGMGTNAYNILPNPLGNFKDILGNSVFQVSLQSTAIMWICNFIPQLGLALLLAAWFTNASLKIRGQGAFKILVYMPSIITAGAIAILFFQFFSYPSGALNNTLVKLGILAQPVDFPRNPTVARGIIAFIQFWMWYGNTMVVLIAGILGINPALFEAAAIDGASGSQTFFRITLPCIRTIMLFTLVTSMIGGLQMFDIPWLFNQGRPNNMTQTASVYVYRQAFTGSFQFNRAAAASVIMLIIAAILSAALFYVMRDRDEAKQRKAEKRARKEAASK